VINQEIDPQVLTISHMLRLSVGDWSTPRLPAMSTPWEWWLMSYSLEPCRLAGQLKIDFASSTFMRYLRH